MIRNQGLHTTPADNNSVTQLLDSVPKTTFCLENTRENWNGSDGQIKPRDALRLSSDCFGKRFKASSVSKTAPSNG